MFEIEQLKYPIGRFKYEPTDRADLSKQIGRITALPANLRRAVQGLRDDQLDTL